MFSLYGLFIGIAIVIFIDYFQKHNKTIPKKKENLFLFLLVFLSFLGARIYFVLGQLPYFLANPNQILNTRQGGLGIFGGIITAILVIYFFTGKKFLKLTDSFITILPFCLSIGRIGNIINHEIYPVCIYESILDFILFLILLITKKHRTATFLIGYGLIRFILEYFRADALPFYLGRVFSLFGIVLGIILVNDLHLSRRQSRKKS